MHIFFWGRKPSLNKALKMLLLISGLFMFAYAMLMPIYALFVEKIGGDVRAASIAYAIFWLVTGLLTFIAGRIENKMKRVELAIVCSQFIIALAYLFYYFIKSIPMLYLAMVVLGIGNAIFWPAFHSLYTRHVNAQRSAWQWGFYDGLTYLIPAVGAFIGGWLVKLYGFGLIFVIMAALSLLNGLFIIILPKKTF